LIGLILLLNARQLINIPHQSEGVNDEEVVDDEWNGLMHESALADASALVQFSK